MPATRRDLLRLGSLSALGIPALSGLAQAGPSSPDAYPGGETACILLWLQGGLSHLDSFDPKPDAPPEIRGEFRAMPTRVPGLYLSEHLPRLAARADKFSIVRGLDPGNGTHGLSDAYALSGHPYDPDLIYPTYGAVIARETGRYDRWFPWLRFGEAIDARFGAGSAGFFAPGYGPFGHASRDPGRPAQGSRAPSIELGQYCEVAARLVELGERFVMVTDGGWDTHRGGFRSLRETLLPSLDAALATLLDRLSETGRLDSTLVVVLSDFGRTPRVNSLGGRDHCATAGVALLAGAGLRGGVVVGATDADGGSPRGTPYTFEDVAVTLYDRMGIPRDTAYPGPDGRIVHVVPDGRPIRELL